MARASRSKRRASGSAARRREHLDRDRPIEARVTGFVDLAHPARAERERISYGPKRTPAASGMVGSPGLYRNWRCHRRRHAPPKRAGQRHERQQPDDRDDDDHDHHLRVGRKLWPADDECGGDVALRRSRAPGPMRVSRAESAEDRSPLATPTPRNTTPGEDAARAEDAQQRCRMFDNGQQCRSARTRLAARGRGRGPA